MKHGTVALEDVVETLTQLTHATTHVHHITLEPVATAVCARADEGEQGSNVGTERLLGYRVPQAPHPEPHRVSNRGRIRRARQTSNLVEVDLDELFQSFETLQTCPHGKRYNSFMDESTASSAADGSGRTCATPRAQDDR